MKKRIVGVLVMISVVGLLLGCVSPAATEGAPKGPAEIKAPPSVDAVTPVVKLQKGVKVVLKGSGFEPGQEIHVLVVTSQAGILAKTNIGFALEPKPVPNEMGAWVSTWTIGRLISKGVITEGVSPIVVTDAEYNSLAYTSVAFYNPKKPPEWAKVVLGAK